MSPAAVVGVHEFADRLAQGWTAPGIQAYCAARALDDAGLTWSDVDALYDPADGGQLSKMLMPEYLGVRPRIVDTTNVGGSSFELHVAHARYAIDAGKADVALITYGSTMRSSGGAPGTTATSYGASVPSEEMELPWACTLISNYALVAARHMHQYGTKPEQLAEIAVVTRAHALRNPEAVKAMEALRFRHQGAITVDDVLGSRMISDPLHQLDCCMVSDGGGAVVVVSEAVARSCRKAPVWVLGTGEAVEYPGAERDITVSAAARSGPEAFGESGVAPHEIDVAMLYDSFTITVLTVLEDLGFCGKGEGGAFASSGCLRFDVDGGPALNTDGGGLSSNHPGMRGLFLLVEAVRQLRGESTSQVPGATLAVVNGIGGHLATRHSSGTVVLGAA